MKNYEIVKFVDEDFELDVKTDFSNETVWLTQKQMASLFDVNVDTIGFHIKNIFNENELDYSASEYSSVTASDGKTYNTKIYNLDMIISVGYRVKSKRGIAFRKWANQVLKSYLLNGYSINDKRCLECKDNLISLNNRVSELEKEKDLLKQEVFGDYYTLVKKGDVPKGIIMLDKIFNLAKEKIVIIDNYIDETIIRYIEKYNKNVVIITGNSKLKSAVFNSNITIVVDNSYHSRYIFVDNEFSYCLTYSLNSIGKKDFDIIFLDKLKPNYIINNNMI